MFQSICWLTADTEKGGRKVSRPPMGPFGTRSTRVFTCVFYNFQPSAMPQCLHVEPENCVPSAVSSCTWTSSSKHTFCSVLSLHTESVSEKKMWKQEQRWKIHQTIFDNISWLFGHIEKHDSENNTQRASSLIEQPSFQVQHIRFSHYGMFYAVHTKGKQSVTWVCGTCRSFWLKYQSISRKKISNQFSPFLLFDQWNLNALRVLRFLCWGSYSFAIHVWQLSVSPKPLKNDVL